MFIIQGHKAEENSLICYSKQIMTGLEGNRQIYLPERFRIASPRVSIDQGKAEVNRKSWGGDPESQGANRSAYYPKDQSLFVLLYHYVTQRKKMIILIGS